MRIFRFFPLALAALFVLALASPGLSADPGKKKQLSPEAQDVLNKLDESQSNLKTLRARFFQEKKSSLLKDVTRSYGMFYFENPDNVLWNYEKPEPSYLLITQNRLLNYHPELKSAQEINITKYRKRLGKYLGIGQSFEQLKKYFYVEYIGKDPKTGRHHIECRPRKKRIEKHIALISLWIDPVLNLPVRVEYTESDGDYMMLSFSEMEVDTDLSGSFVIDIPDSVTVEKIQWRDREHLL